MSEDATTHVQSDMSHASVNWRNSMTKIELQKVLDALEQSTDRLHATREATDSFGYRVCCGISTQYNHRDDCKHIEAINLGEASIALLQAELAKAEPEPVAWMSTDRGMTYFTASPEIAKREGYDTPLFTKESYASD